MPKPEDAEDSVSWLILSFSLYLPFMCFFRCSLVLRELTQRLVHKVVHKVLCVMDHNNDISLFLLCFFHVSKEFTTSQGRGCASDFDF